MESFINDIRTFFANLDGLVKIAIVALLSVCLALALIKFIKVITKDKAKVKIGYFLIFAILTGLLVLISIWSF